MKKQTITPILATIIAAMLTACVGGADPGTGTPDDADTEITEVPTTEVTGTVGDGTSMHALELITLSGDSMYFTYEVNSTDGIEIGDTVRITYTTDMGDDVALSIKKIKD